VHLRKPELTRDPRREYGSPERLLSEARLSVRAKRALRRHWQSDLSLDGAVADGRTAELRPEGCDRAELLKRVSNCLHQLDIENGIKTPRVTATCAGSGNCHAETRA
jgi:hypothetical protein